MALNRGGKAAEKEAESSSFGKLNYFKLAKPGESMVLRFIDDDTDWIYIRQHPMVATKGRPSDYPKDSSWPAVMGAVCRKDKSFTDPGSTPHYTDCYICDAPEMVDSKGKKYGRGVRLWARAVVREAVYDGEDGPILGYRDATHEITTKDASGNETKKTVRKIVLVNMAVKNFFGALQGFADIYHTVLDRDYLITRKGEGTDTDYNIVPLDKIEGFDLRTPELKAKYEAYAEEADASAAALEKVVLDLASDEFYAKFFDPTKQAPAWKGKKGEEKSSTSEAATTGAPAAEQAKPEEEAFTTERLAKLKERVTANGNGAPKNLNDD
jgi:hypothetical protein